MKALVIGFGSIGSRHANILKALRLEVVVVTNQKIDTFPSYTSIQKALSVENFEYIVIANKTCDHFTALQELDKCKFLGKVLVEKPLFKEHHASSKYSFSEIYIAYNLRFHPLILILRKILIDESIISCQIYVGQYLPQWRPQRDYRESYSAHKNEGGGVLLDLSHELDYLNWIFGAWKRLTALGGQLSELEIDSEDIVSVLMETEKCPVLSLQMNYLDRVPRREIIVNTSTLSIKVDMIQGTININGKIEKIETERNDTYQKQHMAILNNDNHNLCNFQQGQEIQSLIKAINTSFHHPKGIWIHS